MRHDEVQPDPAGGQSASDLVSQLSDQGRRLIRDELRLAGFELRDKGKRMGLGAGMAGAAGLLALAGGAVLVAAAVLALALVLPGWAAALVVAGALFVIAGAAGLLGRAKIAGASPPLPEEAIEGVRADVETAKQGVHS
ncbi:phage holin family protein [Amycolatopsis ultiminotia]|uniref:Phage holin family protein n=1 Tax=Amycolatopsis ultiminotia TaxID=543629 RepID=A0ABP6XGA3_9PSEU